jgi:hypothetical protein
MPAAPNYALAAQQTSAGNQNAAIANQIGNMTNQKGVEQFELDPVTGAQKLGADGKPIKLGGTGVEYSNPYAIKDSQGSIPFDMSSLTQKQRDAYNAGKGLPKDFVKTYDPQQWTQESVLGGNDRTLYDQSQAAQLGLSGIALKGLDAVRQATDPNDPRYKKIDPSIAIQGGPANTADRMTTSVGGGTFSGGAIDTGGVQYGVSNAGTIGSSIADAGSIANDLGIIGGNVATSGATGVAQTVLDNNGNLIRLDSGANERARGLARGQQNAGQIQTTLGIDPQLLNQQAVDALYKANTQYLDPQFAQSQAKMESQLANQGITRGSEAYNNAMLNFNNQKQQAYTDARNQAIGQGTAAAQGMFGMGLQGAQFGNEALGQQFGQYTTAQQLANSAAGQNNANAQTNQQLYNAALNQQFGQGLQTAQFGNQAIAQNNATALSNAQFANAAQQQMTDQQLARAGFTNAAQAQLYGQNANAAQFANTAQAQQFGQNQANQQANNAATAQQYGMIANNEQLRNAAQQQTFDAGLANANLNNQQLSQLYNQQLQSGQMNNQASNLQLAQNQAIQQNPLNILQALRTGAQLNTANLPSVGVSQPAQLANWQGADMLGAATAKGQYDQSMYNAQLAAQSQMISAGIGAAGALGGAGIGAAVKSDRRLKKNIKRIGTHVLGIGLYTWDYLWGEPFAGVMADEVEQVMPEAIVMHPSGFKMVNYEMLGLV